MPAMLQKPKELKFLVIGAGSRGNAYSEPITETTSAQIYAVAEPLPYKRQLFGRKYIWGPDGSPQEGQEFVDWKAWLEWETDRRRRQAQGEPVPDGVDGVFVCTLDEMHVEIMVAIAPLNLHVLCEKPLATSLADCLSIYRARTPEQQSKIFSIGHVLRYSPHNITLRKLLLTDRVIGDVLSIEHTEPVAWWHFAHSYVRGNWRRQSRNGDGSLLTKCSHDVDFLLWMLSSPPTGAPIDTQPHLPRSISSMGARSMFRQSRKPLAAGNATNCLSCPMERDCHYSAVKIYHDHQLAKGDTHWPVHIVCPDIEDVLKTSGMEVAQTQLFDRLAEDYDRTTAADAEIAARSWYGRCVYESDNDVCDDQLVTISWDEDNTAVPPRPGKRAVLHMAAQTEKECERRGRVYGTHGELEYDSHQISYFSFVTRETTVVEVPQQTKSLHGGGDYGLARAFVAAVDAVENQGLPAHDAQVQFIGCTFDEAVRSQVVVFAAEEARRDEKVIQWQDWWKEKTASIVV
ncbi:putative NAD binding Rossmann fold oxidoreductase [Talaromyces proteolyticus]|uniref:NAD binding Rossmann fold oxidoreductase n=1 Tax=Talaromyces proteolyticus TaxID=1131652 RepID=A0AAD4KGG3_9EURO|nr:putative NAD binding Rossmann fold oxidoreductase [Talaromyces proteolyticus]KAH8691180.1 putative NAD binding Rossmann fold oxidoreductase [Talaromyces proteolyticus]